MIIPLWKYIKLARDDEELRDRALDVYMAAMPGLKSKMKARNGLRGSDAGKCTHELFATIHGLLDIPEDTEGALSRLDIGTLYGAWIASLCKVGFDEAQDLPNIVVEVEAEGVYQGVRCHADLLFSERDGDAIMPVSSYEVKTNYAAENPKPPHEQWPFQCVQAAHQACAFPPINDFGIFTFAPAAQWKKGVAPIRYDQANYQLDERTRIEGQLDMTWRERVDHEYGVRLQKAMEATPPACDARESWRPKYCRLSTCPGRILKG